ncbi:uncharacterized protein KGF55_004885 [Candida pseudojiufengensis]|uniref:uncharacterized protein n=1 Tax=Candida pseudojiufengensis TaxID=497109 RepID=UPI0022258938|nr:uncharacterized protein KGF55_004885 [Candida pseudojiufengensis]KAI5960162.1 hypothetical protein KGF55_004885 [Candida pseudojiufengensis]
MSTPPNSYHEDSKKHYVIKDGLNLYSEPNNSGSLIEFMEHIKFNRPDIVTSSSSNIEKLMKANFDFSNIIFNVEVDTKDDYKVNKVLSIENLNQVVINNNHYSEITTDIRIHNLKLVNPSFLLAFPKNLTKLYVHTKNEIEGHLALESLPLTNLEIKYINTSNKGCETMTLHLPLSLKSLSLENINTTRLTIKKQKLLDLKIVNCSNSVLSKLIHTFGDLNSLIIKHQLSLKNSISLKSTEFSMFKRKIILSNISKIKDLQIDGPFMLNESLISTEILKLSKVILGSLFKLPPVVRELVLDEVPNSSNMLKDLPKQITTLNLSCFESTNLSLSYLKNLSSLDISCSNIPNTSCPIIRSLQLPITVKKLNYLGSAYHLLSIHNSEITGLCLMLTDDNIEFFPQFPESLKVLKFNNKDKPLIINYLTFPKDLETLLLQSVAVQNPSVLPRTIKYLNHQLPEGDHRHLSNIILHYHDESRNIDTAQLNLKHCSNLSYLRVENSRLKNLDLRELPRSIQYLILKNNEIMDIEGDNNDLKLKVMDLSQNLIIFSGREFIMFKDSIQYLDLSENIIQDLPSMLTVNWSDLQVFILKNINDFWDFTDFGKAITASCPHLKYAIYTSQDKEFFSYGSMN